MTNYKLEWQTSISGRSTGNLSIHRSVQTDTAVYSASYIMDTGQTLPRGPTCTSAEVK